MIYLIMKYLGYDGHFGEVETPEAAFSTKEAAEKYIKNRKGYSILEMKLD